METPKDNGPNISNEVQNLIGAQTIQIISLNKQVQELRQMCSALETELKNSKAILDKIK